MPFNDNKKFPQHIPNNQEWDDSKKNNKNK